MIASAIHELVASDNPMLIAAAYLEERVQIWDLSCQRMISEFPIVFCSGAKNLAIAPTADLIVAGRSRSSGKVAAYKVPSGEKVWERALRYPRGLRFQSAGEPILCSTNNSSVVRLDVHTGKTLETVRGVRKLLDGPYGDTLMVSSREKRDPFHIVARGGTFDVKESGFALLDAQFSPRSLCMTEARGLVRSISCVDGTIEWTFDPGPNSHVTRLHYSQPGSVFWGVLRDLTRTDLGARQLVKFDPVSGIPEKVCALDSSNEAFVSTANQCITSSGEIRHLDDGALAGRLAFPQTEYPDK